MVIASELVDVYEIKEIGFLFDGESYKDRKEQMTEAVGRMIDLMNDAMHFSHLGIAMGRDSW